jgi:hypothetical protein
MTRVARRPGPMIPAAMPAHPASSPTSPERPGLAEGASWWGASSLARRADLRATPCRLYTEITVVACQAAWKGPSATFGDDQATLDLVAVERVVGRAPAVSLCNVCFPGIHVRHLCS